MQARSHSVKKYYHDKGVLITGASGFIGSHLTKTLVESGAQVYGVVGPRSDPGRLSALHEDIEILQGDLLDMGNARDVIRKSKPSVVFNLASTTKRERSLEHVGAFVQNIYGITHNILSAAQEESVSRFIQVGSMEEYGAAQAPFVETTREEPITPYGLGKFFATHAALLYGRVSDMKVTVIRPAAVFGEGQDFGQMLIPNIIKAGLDGIDFNMGTGEYLRDFIYIDDLVEGMLLAGASDAATNEVINLGTGTGIVVREVAEMTNAAMGEPIKILFGTTPSHPFEKNAYLDCSKAKKLLGWRECTPLAQAVKKTADWYRKKYSR